MFLLTLQFWLWAAAVLVGVGVALRLVSTHAFWNFLGWASIAGVLAGAVATVMWAFAASAVAGVLAAVVVGGMLALGHRVLLLLRV